METAAAVASTSGRIVAAVPAANFSRRRRQSTWSPLPAPLRRSCSHNLSFKEIPKSTFVTWAAPGCQEISRGGGGRGSISLGVQPSPSSLTSASPTTTPMTASSSPLASAAAAAVLALAAAWAASSFAKERGAVSSSASAAGLFGGNVRRKRGKKLALAFGGPSGASSSPSLPPRTYRAALSVTRRSVALTRAVQAADFGNIAGALTELDRALAEHLAAGGRWGGEREGRGADGGAPPPPLPSGAAEEDMRRLYVLHLQNSDLPALPEELEPLRSLLRIGAGEAAEVEAEVLSQSGGFSI